MLNILCTILPQACSAASDAVDPATAAVLALLPDGIDQNQNQPTRFQLLEAGS